MALFVGEKEVNFFNTVAKELVQDVVSQKIIYYSVSEEHTKTHKLYDEAIRKTVYRPVEVNALVLFKEPEQSTNQFTIDTQYFLEVYFHHHELEERRLIPREGDFVKWNKVVYEIEKLTAPQITFGQIQHEVMIKAECRVSRKSQFKVLDEDIQAY